MKGQNNYAYIDNANLHKGVKELGWTLDFKRFLTYLKDKYGVDRAYIFIGYIPEHKRLYENFQQWGYTLVFKDIVQDARGKVKGNALIPWLHVSSIKRLRTADTPGMNNNEFETPLDPGISDAVQTLRHGGIETFESCEGGQGHAYAEPTVRFHGDKSEGFRALAIALRAGLHVTALRRTYDILDGEPTGPWWELTFVITKAP